MSLFITGSTGFLGTGLLYLLYEKKYEYPIYLLIRKKKQTAIERFIEIQNNFPLLKLHLIENELSEITKIKLQIDYIINCAASIEFNLELQEAIIQNVDGVLNLIEFAKNNNIKNFIHISTAYVSEHSKYVKEKFINMKILGNINELYSKIKSNKITFNEIINKKYFSNTYCFTKCLAEKFIEKESKKNEIFFQIIRPSIITNSEKTPYPGWFKGYSATIGIHKLICSNLLNVLICDKNTKLDYIPVDHVAKKIYKSLNKRENKKKILIKHSTSYFMPTIEETISFLNKNNLNIQIFDKKNITYYFYKYYNLLKIVFMIMLNYLLSFIYKEKMYIVKKLIKILNLIYSVQNKFDPFLHNTFYFKNRIHNNLKKRSQYYNIMVNEIKNITTS
jgi:nucleoside-diphosphate-sugar epimerase